MYYSAISKSKKKKMHMLLIGTYNNEHLFSFLDDLYESLVLQLWDNAMFHHSLPLTYWFIAYHSMVSFFLPPYSPFLNLIEECSPAAFHAGCLDISEEDCQGWI